MKTRLAVAPCSWGIEDPSNKDNAPWKSVLDDAVKAGYTGLELGPFGYFPLDSVLLREQLQSRNLCPVAATIYDDLASPGNLKNLVKKAHAVCGLLSSLLDDSSLAYVVIIDAVKPGRNNTAGQSDKTLRLEKDSWHSMKGHIAELCRISAGTYGIRPVIHPHAGGYIEFEDETERVMQELPHDLVGLCLDTGHLQYAGGDPSESLTKYAKRLDYVHFKDINQQVYTRAIGSGTGFFDACKDGVMCSIGKGCLDYARITRTLRELEYEGWITIEQERDPRNYAGTLSDISESRKFLISQGFEA